jgi:hypothetical protein
MERSPIVYSEAQPPVQPVGLRPEGPRASSRGCSEAEPPETSPTDHPPQRGGGGMDRDPQSPPPRWGGWWLGAGFRGRRRGTAAARWTDDHAISGRSASCPRLLANAPSGPEAPEPIRRGRIADMDGKVCRLYRTGSNSETPRVQDVGPTRVVRSARMMKVLAMFHPCREPCRLKRRSNGEEKTSTNTMTAGGRMFWREKSTRFATRFPPAADRRMP